MWASGGWRDTPRADRVPAAREIVSFWGSVFLARVSTTTTTTRLFSVRDEASRTAAAPRFSRVPSGPWARSRVSSPHSASVQRQPTGARFMKSRWRRVYGREDDRSLPNRMLDTRPRYLRTKRNAHRDRRRGAGNLLLDAHEALEPRVGTGRRVSPQIKRETTRKRRISPRQNYFSGERERERERGLQETRGFFYFQRSSREVISTL